MKILSIKEPFASLIATKQKKIETRSWKTKYRGEIYIHASITPGKKDKRISDIMKLVDPKPGYILCKCNLTDCIYMDEAFLKKIHQNKEEYLYGHYEIGRYAWILEDVEIIEPIYAKGKLGIWNYEKEGK